MDEAKFANDFEERHGWSSDIGYEVVEPKPKKKKKDPKLTPKQEKFVAEYTRNGGNAKRHRKLVEWEEWDSDDFGEPHNLGYFNLSEYMEVIGNIHDNPELLEEK